MTNNFPTDPSIQTPSELHSQLRKIIAPSSGDEARYFPLRFVVKRAATAETESSYPVTYHRVLDEMNALPRGWRFQIQWFKALNAAGFHHWAMNFFDSYTDPILYWLYEQNNPELFQSRAGLLQLLREYLNSPHTNGIFNDLKLPVKDVPPDVEACLSYLGSSCEAGCQGRRFHPLEPTATRRMERPDSRKKALLGAPFNIGGKRTVMVTSSSIPRQWRWFHVQDAAFYEAQQLGWGDVEGTADFQRPSLCRLKKSSPQYIFLRTSQIAEKIHSIELSLRHPGHRGRFQRRRRGRRTTRVISIRKSQNSGVDKSQIAGRRG